MYMIYVALQSWRITTVCIALPLVLIGVYFQKIYHVDAGFDEVGEAVVSVT